jgi:hypothetical protein
LEEFSQKRANVVSQGEGEYTIKAPYKMNKPLQVHTFPVFWICLVLMPIRIRIFPRLRILPFFHKCVELTEIMSEK